MGAKAGHTAIEIVTLENGAVVKSLHGLGCSKNSVWYSVYGSKGRMETAREDAELNDVSRVYENLDSFEGENKNNPVSHIVEDELAKKGAKHGHGGSDFICLYNAVEHILGNPDAEIVDVYQAAEMWMPGFFGYISALNGNMPQAIPDLRRKEVRDLYRKDTRCTDRNAAGDQLLPSYSKGNPDIDPAIYALCKRRWEEERASGK
ncbi:MAG: hypothetical protein IKM02_03340, partial [Clostridia bacterium]|nr:hypothetical protein [Clostridia bacterium]